MAVIMDDIKTVKILLKYGADTNIKDNDCETPLTYAVRMSHTKIIRELLKTDADINTKNIWGDTPLIIAIRNKKKKIVRALLEAGVLSIVDNNVKFERHKKLLHNNKIVSSCIMLVPWYHKLNNRGKIPKSIIREAKEYF
jgi:ankyrin repeat protein